MEPIALVFLIIGVSFASAAAMTAVKNNEDSNS